MWHPNWRAMLAGFFVAAMASPSAGQQQDRLLFDPSDMRYRPDGGAAAPAARPNSPPTVRNIRPVPAESVGAGIEAPRPATREQPAAFGRVPVDNFSFGIETSTKLKTDKLPDGSPIPGMQSDRRQNTPPFLGLSVTVPTN
jgi:hypothetical protein